MLSSTSHLGSTAPQVTVNCFSGSKTEAMLLLAAGPNWEAMVKSSWSHADVVLPTACLLLCVRPGWCPGWCPHGFTMMGIGLGQSSPVQNFSDGWIIQISAFWHVVPHIFAWGSCFWFCIPPPPPSSASSAAGLLSHKKLCHPPSFTHNFVNHNFVTHHLSQTTLSHTIFHTQLFFVTHHLSQTTLPHTIFHTQLFCHTPSFTDNFATHHLSRTTLSHTIFHTKVTHNFVNHNFFTHHLSHNFVTHNFVTHHLSHITLSHKTLSITTFSPHLCTWRHPLSLCVAGVALMALGWLWWRAWARLVARGAAPLCVAGVALGDIHLRFAWQACHLATSTFTLHGRRGTYGTGLALVARLGAVSRPRVAGVALGDIRFAWQVWHWVTWFTTTNLS